MRFVVVGAGRLSRQPLRSSGRLLLGWRSLPLAVVWAVSGCTLTSDSFEPSLVDRNVVANAPVATDPTPVETEEPASGGGTSTPPSPTDGEAATGPVRLDSPEGTDGRLGDNGAGSRAADAGGADAGGADAWGADAGGDPPDVIASAEADAGEPTPPVPECPGQVLGGSCYAFFDQPASWTDAEQGCVAWGGHLAVVESSEEDAFLHGLPSVADATAATPPGFWLGGTDAALDGLFVWLDGSALVFDGFAPNQPDNGTGVDCIEKRNDATALWYDQRCTDEYPYVCERPL